MKALLGGLKLAVDVQHLYRDGIHRWDRGAWFTVPWGRVAEADLVLSYAQVLIAALRGWGATVLTNDPGTASLVGPYQRRQLQAMKDGAAVYLACHVNAGGGDYGRIEYVSERELGGSLAASLTTELKDSLPELKSVSIHRLFHDERGRVCVEGFSIGPALIVEPFFGDCPGHAPLTTPAGLERVGLALARGVADWWTITHPGGG